MCLIEDLAKRLSRNGDVVTHILNLALDGA